MTKAKIKPEDYREINDYWCRRLLELDEETEWDIWQELIEDLANPKRKHEDVYQCLILPEDMQPVSQQDGRAEHIRLIASIIISEIYNDENKQEDSEEVQESSHSMPAHS